MTEHRLRVPPGEVFDQIGALISFLVLVRLGGQVVVEGEGGVAVRNEGDEQLAVGVQEARVPVQGIGKGRE